MASIKSRKEYSIDGKQYRIDGDKDSVIEGGETVISKNYGTSY